MKTAEQIGKILRKMRLAKDITQLQIAEIIGTTQANYSLFEKGKRIPSDEIKYKIARFYGLTVDDIFFKTNDSNTNRRAVK